MIMRLSGFITTLLLTHTLSNHCLADGWHHPLYLDGGGYWPSRVALTVTSAVELMGAAKSLSVGAAPGQINLIGAEARSVRVIDEEGRDLLYGLHTSTGEPVCSGKLKSGDILTVPFACPAGGTRRVFVYFGNSRAREVPEFLSGGFANGGFESGEEEPTTWRPWGGDGEHLLAWVAESPHSGKRCVRATAPSGERSWFKYVQTGIPVVPGQPYEVRGWVRAENVKGSAGWYVHVNGVKPQMINQVANAGEGTYGWKEVTLRFTVPEGGATLDVGTVLYGTGTAWYDDCSISAAETGPTVEVSVGPVESAGMRELPVRSVWSAKSPVRVPLRVCNFYSSARPDALIAADLRRALLVSRTSSTTPAIRVFDATTSQELPSLMEGPKTIFQANLPAKSVAAYYVYLCSQDDPSRRRLGPDALIVGPKNRVLNADFEDGDALPTHWDLSAQRTGGQATATGRRVAGGKTGTYCAELVIPPNVEPAWSGWHQFISAEPRATYLIGCWMKCKDVDGEARLHAHLRTADRQLVSASPYLSTSPALHGATDWTWTQTIVRTPEDARFIELHLTSNAHGTIWHDGVVVRQLADTLPAQAQALDSPTPKGLSVWRVNPIIKVFRDDPAGADCKSIEVALARNEREPVQLALKSDRALSGLQISVSPLKSKSGEALPAVEVARVGYVPVDYPTSYYSINVPAWQRKIPVANPSCDGWAGEWPDPLPPADRIDLAANETQPVWLTVHAPEGATPGIYDGQIRLDGSGVTRIISIRVRVHSFALPKRPSLQITYDLRGVAGEEAKRWYRLMAQHRCSPGMLPQPQVKLENGEAKMDFTEFDQAAAYCFDDLGMSAMYTPWCFYALGWAYSPQKFLGLEAFTPEWEKAFGSALRQYVEHVRERGWLGRFTLYLSDEPFEDRKEVMANLNRFARFVQSVAPGLPIYSSTWRHIPALYGAVTHWGAGHYGCFPVERIRERLAAGDRVWFTTDGQQCLDTPYAGTERMLAWYCYKYEVRGFEFWGVNWHTYDPWKFGWHSFIQQSSSEKEEAYWVRYPNGDGYVAYPGKPVGVEGPVSSLRLEAVRDGEEDYEYLLLLQQRIAAAKASGKNVAEAEALLTRALNLLSIPNPGGLRTTEWLKDPEEVLKIRDEVAEQIEGMRG